MNSSLHKSILYAAHWARWVVSKGIIIQLTSWAVKVTIINAELKWTIYEFFFVQCHTFATTHTWIYISHHHDPSSTHIDSPGKESSPIQSIVLASVGTQWHCLSMKSSHLDDVGVRAVRSDPNLLERNVTSSLCIFCSLSKLDLEEKGEDG